MKLLIALLFAVASLVNGPAPCAHALGLNTDNGAHDAAGEIAHADVMHQDIHAPHHSHTDNEQTQHSNSHKGCADNCDGGYGCDGCAIGAAAVLTQDVQAAHPAPAILLAAPSNIHTGAVLATDPPPPRIA